MLTIVDYGAGNLKSLQNALAFLRIPSQVTREPEVVAAAEKLILPGVGAFGFAMGNLKKFHLDEALCLARDREAVILGICLGMQLLLTGSEENGGSTGLDFVPGVVQKLKTVLKVPHTGWNVVDTISSSPLVKDLPEPAFAYFVHSYVCRPKDDAMVVATTNYDSDFCSVLARDNVFGTQFHPEKSQEVGLQILKNFSEIK